MSPDGSQFLFARSFRGMNRAALRAFQATLTERVLGGRSFHCLLSSDEELRFLNRRFLSLDYATDVLSFPSLPGTELAGELAISLDRARAQAAEQGHSVETEIRVLMLHGVLHLKGMDHEKDNGAMRRAETRWRREFALSAGLIERSDARRTGRKRVAS
jgi:probable rRNA maturation factor